MDLEAGVTGFLFCVLLLAFGPLGYKPSVRSPSPSGATGFLFCVLLVAVDLFALQFVHDGLCGNVYYQ